MGVAGMTPEHRLAQIIGTIQAIKMGAPVSKGLGTILMKPWPDPGATHKGLRTYL
jgi:fructose-specific phosphotransferase system IIC component